MRYRIKPEPEPLSWQAHILILGVWFMVALLVIAWLALAYWAIEWLVQAIW